MVDAERLARLLRRVTDDVARLSTYVDADPDALLDDEVVLDHLKYRFVTAIEAMIDAAHHVCATEGFATPETNAEALLELGRHALLDAETAQRTARAVGFRNVLVHRYAEVRDERVIEQLTHLEAFNEFVRALSSNYL